MNGLDRVHPATRHRVLDIVVTQRTHTIGFVIPIISDPFYFGIVRGIEEGAAAEGYCLGVP